MNAPEFISMLVTRDGVICTSFARSSCTGGGEFSTDDAPTVLLSRGTRTVGPAPRELNEPAIGGSLSGVAGRFDSKLARFSVMWLISVAASSAPRELRLFRFEDEPPPTTSRDDGIAGSKFDAEDCGVNRAADD